MRDRPDWNAIFRYEPDGTLWHKEQNKFKKMNRPVGYKTKKGYLRVTVIINGKRKNFFVSNIVWEMFNGPITPGMKIDHKNNIVYDNRIENLQELTNRENTAKQVKRKDNTSGYKGVTLVKNTGKYQARIFPNGKTVSLGCFNTPEEAHEAYKKAAVHYFGQDLARFE